MFNRIAAGLLLSALLSPAFAAMSEDMPPPANAQVKKIDNVGEYLQKVRDTMTLAHDGGYGKIAKADMKRAVAAQATIEQTLAGRTDASGLSDDQLIALANAQEVINSIIRADQKNRMVCTREAPTGSRLPSKEECMTVAEREFRAQEAARHVREQQQNLGCVRDYAGNCAH